MNDLFARDGGTPGATPPRGRSSRTWAKVILIVVCIVLIGWLTTRVVERRSIEAAQRASVAAAAAATEADLIRLSAAQLAAACHRAGREPYVQPGSAQRQCLGPGDMGTPAPPATDEEKAAILPLYQQVYADRLAARGLPQMMQGAPMQPKTR